MAQKTYWIRFKEHIFYSNYFYGLCAVVLSIEAMLQHQIPLNHWSYFFVTFSATVLFYSYPYVRKCNYISANARTNWHTTNYTWMRWNQFFLLAVLLVAFIVLLVNYVSAILIMSITHWLLIIIFPAAGFLYYGGNLLSAKYNLRKIGWLKPFIIGFIWAGMITVYPVLFSAMVNKQEYNPGWIGALLFLKNLMFITVLCIMFDIKDYAGDYISSLKTFVVRVGLRKTIFYILLPLSFIGLSGFIYYALTHHFHTGKLLLNIIPFLLLIAVGISLRRRRPLLYYLSIVDGLMIAKAACGIVAMIYF